ncbi:MAG: hypothetical protein IPG70_13370 [Moraxellaceae bacterium]|nr:hypothetical protein [Moraxellaceae bacterium]
MSSEWLTLQQNIEPQLTQLALSSDYAINTLCQFPAQFWHMYQQGDLTQAQPRPYYHQQLTKLLADKTTDFFVDAKYSSISSTSHATLGLSRC